MSTKKSSSSAGNWYTRLRDRLPVRSKWLMAISAVIVVGVGSSLLYRAARQHLASQPQYQLLADSIDISPPPPWIRTDIKAEVLENSELLAGVSVLNEPQKLHTRLADAFGLHPWVEQVERIEIVPPAGARIKLTYRRPVAAVEVKRGQFTDLHLVDAKGIRLPDTDLTEAERLYLPRITGIQGSVLVGEPWTDPQVMGAIQIATQISARWASLHLVEVKPMSFEIRSSQKYYLFELVASYGTRILWGAAPGMAPPGEQTADEKMARLEGYIAEHGPLNSTYTPEMIDIRDRLTIRQRTAKKDDGPQPVAR